MQHSNSAYRIHAIKAMSDNYIWAICQHNQAVIIDPGVADGVLEFLTQNQLDLTAILITHHHDDHIGGVATLKQHYPNLTLYAQKNHNVLADVWVDEGSQFAVLGLDFAVWRTAGHTDTHISYLCQIDGRTQVFCGDTLFYGGCGRVFTGTIDELYDSMMRYATLADDTLFYPAHEYTLSNLRFALTVATTPQQQAINAAIEQVEQKLATDGCSLPTDLATQQQVNVFLQVADADFAKHLQQKYALPDDEPRRLFALLRTLKNQA